MSNSVGPIWGSCLGLHGLAVTYKSISEACGDSVTIGVLGQDRGHGGY